MGGPLPATALLLVVFINSLLTFVHKYLYVQKGNGRSVVGRLFWGMSI